MPNNMTYLQGAFILTIANLLTGILSFVYRIFLSKSIGAEGMGVYQLIIPLYMLFITLVSGGLATSISKLVAENKAKGNYSNMFKIIRVSALMAALWSIIFSCLIAFNADFLAREILKDDRTLYSVIIFSPAIVFIALAAVFKGYFYGVEKIKIPAFLDIIEKLIRLIILVVTTDYLIDFGIEYVCAGAMTAMVSGELLSLLLLFIIYRRKKFVVRNIMKTDSTLHIASNILMIVIPLSISGAINTIMDMLDAALIPAQLVKAGFSKQISLSLYGQLTGMILPLIYFPMIIIGSLSTTLIPSVAFSYTSKNWIALNKKCNDSLTIASIIGLASTIAFMMHPRELCDVLFNCPEAEKLLFWCSISCVLEYWLFVLLAIMNGIGLQKNVLESTIMNIVIMVVSIVVFMPIPKINVYGYILGFAVSSLFVVWRCLNVLIKKTSVKIDEVRCILKPLICSVPMLCLIWLSNYYLVSNTSFKYNMILSYILGLILYFTLLLFSGAIKPSQIFNVLSFRIPRT